MKKPLMIVAGLAVVGALALGAFYAYELLGSDNPNLATEAPSIGTATSATPGSSSATPATGSSAAASNDINHFVIDPSQSTAKFVVHETLRGVANVTTVGTTSAITGDLYLTPQGLVPTPKSSFSVDLTTLKTDTAMRDNYIKQNTLQTAKFPTADFNIDSLSDFPASYVEGSEADLSLTGTMTIHGVSKPVTWTVKARHSGDVLTATADADVTMTDFGMTPPDVGVAKAQDDVHLQVVFVSNRATG